jgi:hypothetical protein
MSGEQLNAMGLGATDKPGSLRCLLRGDDLSDLLQEWDGFVQEVLHSILDHQMVGTYTALSNLSALSQVCFHKYTFISIFRMFLFCHKNVHRV